VCSSVFLFNIDCRPFLLVAELAKIEQDKMVRQRDENWSAKAAGVKGGKPIETFRGKFGEDNSGGG
jgi:hypothetical protein